MELQVFQRTCHVFDIDWLLSRDTTGLYQAGRAALPPQIAAAAEEKRTAALEAVKARGFSPMGTGSGYVRVNWSTNIRPG